MESDQRCRGDACRTCHKPPDDRGRIATRKPLDRAGQPCTTGDSPDLLGQCSCSLRRQCGAKRAPCKGLERAGIEARGEHGLPHALIVLGAHVLTRPVDLALGAANFEAQVGKCGGVRSRTRCFSEFLLKQSQACVGAHNIVSGKLVVGRRGITSRGIASRGLDRVLLDLGRLRQHLGRAARRPGEVPLLVGDVAERSGVPRRVVHAPELGTQFYFQLFVWIHVVFLPSGESHAGNCS